jgi:hypothetical protein
MIPMSETYMLDTNVFNAVLDGRVFLASSVGRILLVTGIQRDELGATAKPGRRAALLAVYKEIRPTSLPASSFAFDIEGAGFDQAYWNDGAETLRRCLLDYGNSTTRTKARQTRCEIF